MRKRGKAKSSGDSGFAIEMDTSSGGIGLTYSFPDGVCYKGGRTLLFGGSLSVRVLPVALPSLRSESV